MPDAFQKKSDFEDEQQFTDSPHIPSLTDDIVYCPKCGTINSFKKSKSGKQLNLFCSRCSLRMNDFWDAYLEGHLRLIICKKCGESTFKGSFYCITCGKKQEKAYRERTDKISEALGDDFDLVSAMGEVQEIRREARSKYPCFIAFCDCMSCLNDCGNCLSCCMPFGSCIAVQFVPTFTPILKTAFSISFVLFAMFQTTFLILFFHSYIGANLFYGVLSAGIILTILVPIVFYLIQRKTNTLDELQ